MSRRIAVVLFALVVIVFALAVWPTPYRALVVHVTGGIAAARQNRITGRVEWLEQGDPMFR